MTKKNRWLLTVGIFFGLSLFSPMNGYAQKKVLGEIININYKFRIAFTDLSSFQLSVGEIVEVYQDGKLITDLKVSEVSSAISKLVPQDDQGSSTNYSDFKLIKVGDKISKKISSNAEIVSQQLKEVESTMFPSSDVSKTSCDEECEIVKEKYGVLSVSIAEMVNEKRLVEAEVAQLEERFADAQNRIEEVNKKLKDQDEELQKFRYFDRTQGGKKEKHKVKSLENMVYKLKQKLEYMTQLIEREEN